MPSPTKSIKPVAGVVKKTSGHIPEATRVFILDAYSDGSTQWWVTIML